MNVALSKYYEDMVGDLIESGRYGNSSEVVRAGLRALEKAEQQAALNIPGLDRKLLAGVRSPAKPLTAADFDRIRSRTRRNSRNLKPLKIIRAGEAIQDIADIHLFIAVENPDAAEGFLAALRSSFRTLAQWPEIGPRHQSNRAELAGLRFWPVRRFTNYLIFYRVMEKPGRLHIVRILHGARDMPQVLG